MVAEAVLCYSNITKTIGLCNVPIAMHMEVTKMLKVNQKRVHIDFAGLNHMVYGLAIYLDGEVITEKVLDKLTGGAEMTMRNIVDLSWGKDFIKALKVLSCLCRRYVYQTREIVEQQRNIKEKGRREQVVQELEEELFELYSDKELSIKQPQLEEPGGAYYSDAACNLINSIYNNKHDIQVVNEKNNGAIASIPPDSAVEVSCMITKEGPKWVVIGELPVPVRDPSFKRLKHLNV